MSDRDEAMAAWLRDGAVPARTEYSVDGWELRSHPDFEERFVELAHDRAHVTHRYGVAVMETGGTVYAVAAGTGWLLLRLGEQPDDVLPKPAVVPGWAAVDAYQVQLLKPEGTKRLRRWVAEAATRAR